MSIPLLPLAILLPLIFGFLVLRGAGGMPGAWALPAGLGDMAVGILALSAAIASGTKSRRAAGVAWNLLGIADAVMAITLGALTAPGPLQLQALAPDQPNVLVGAYPVALTPAFVVPLSLILHGLSLRQLRRQAARDGLQLATAVQWWSSSVGQCSGVLVEKFIRAEPETDNEAARPRGEQHMPP